jgi:hypothetical protein
MQKLSISAALVGGIFLTPLAGVAQNIVSLPEPNSTYLVFLEESGLSATAKELIGGVASAVQPGRGNRLSGQTAHVEAVKRELLRDGVPPSSIVVRRDIAPSLPTTADGIDEPQHRRVEIQF